MNAIRQFFLVVALLAGTAVAMASERVDIPLDADSAAMLYVFPAEDDSRVAVISCPGGGYAHHAMNHEGFDMAEWFTSQGITYAVLRYRLPDGVRTVPSEDGFKAIRLMRGMADKVGIMGFSAGGHLASTLATHYPDSLTRPDFQILFYPVVTMDASFTHRGSRDNLLGKNSSEETVVLYSNEKQVSADTPEAIVFHCADDKSVPVRNALDYCGALAACGVPVTMHIFPTGGHGWGFRDSYEYKPAWTSMLGDWLKHIRK